MQAETGRIPNALQKAGSSNEPLMSKFWALAKPATSNVLQNSQGNTRAALMFDPLIKVTT